MTNKLLQILIVTTLLCGCVAPNFKGDLGVLSRNADAVIVGYSFEQIVAVLGSPQAYFVSPIDSDITYAHYCFFGMFEEDDNGFFLYKDRMYKRVQNINENSRSLGVYSNGQVGDWNCYQDVVVDWNKIPLNSAIKAEKLARQTRALEKEEQARERASQLVTKEYFIDGLVIKHFQDAGVNCSKGGFYQIELKGSIGPDSSFAIEELLKRSPNCLDKNNEIVSRTSVLLDSGGGMLKDGYMMGRAFRENGVKTVIGNGTICASSCAVAYLGGAQRVFEGEAMIMFHSPYLPGLNAQGKRTANCNIGTNSTQALLAYYQTMTTVEQGQRLMNRTISYCSAEDGWVVRGYSAAELFGVATEI